MDLGIILFAAWTAVFAVVVVGGRIMSSRSGQGVLTKRIVRRYVEYITLKSKL